MATNHDCQPCALAEEMLVEWRRHSNKADDYRRFEAEAEADKVRYMDGIASREALRDALDAGAARDRLTRDIERLAKDLDSAMDDLSEARSKAKSSDVIAGQFMAAAVKAHTCGHRGYLTVGTWNKDRGEFSTGFAYGEGGLPFLRLYENLQDLADYLPKAKGYWEQPATLWPTDLVLPEARGPLADKPAGMTTLQYMTKQRSAEGGQS